MQQKRSSIFKTPLIIAIVTLSLLFVALYFGWLGEAAGVGAKFCESAHEGLIKQPVNTWSNLGFVVVGLWVGYKQSLPTNNSNNNPFDRGLFFSTFYASLAVLLGPGSMAMHASTTQVGGFLDMLSMYMIASFLMAYALKRLFLLKPAGFSVFFVLLMIICIYFNFQKDIRAPFVGHIGSFVFGLLLIISAGLELLNFIIRRVKIALLWGIASIAAMLIATFIWKMSQSWMPWCDPSSLVQGHGFWHLLNALSIYLLYRYYVSEKAPLPTAG